MRTRVKICGITRCEDAILASELGADAIGLVFHPASTRAVEIPRAAEIAASVPPFLTVVGLFVDAPRQRVERVLRDVRIDMLQFHGDEPASHCRAFGRPYLKAFVMGPGMDVARSAGAYHDAAGFLLDGHRAGLAGGTGTPFDWARVPERLTRPLVLAGGLTPENVADAIRAVRPYAVDVSTGVETAPGIKDRERMRAFLRGVRSVDAGEDHRRAV